MTTATHNAHYSVTVPVSLAPPGGNAEHFLRLSSPYPQICFSVEML